MTQYTREIVQSEILDDSMLVITLGELCVLPEKAVAGDILAVEFAWRRTGSVENNDVLYDSETPSHVLVKQDNGGALLIPWYTLANELNLKDGQVSMIATCFAQAANHYSLPIFEHLCDMGSPATASLLVGPGYGGLSALDLDETFDSDDITNDEEMQQYIWRHSAVVLRKITSNHARMSAAADIENANRLINTFHCIFDPRSFDVIKPAASLD